MANKFLGATIENMQSSVGWDSQGTNVQVDLIENLLDGDLFTPPIIGEPYQIQVGSYKFDGIAQLYKTTGDTSANPKYSITLVSPTLILENTQLIVDTYRGVNLICPNLLNIFGYLEGGGANFGGSRKNASGIPWWMIAEAFNAIQKGGTEFAVGIQHKSHKYIFDVTSLPKVPDFYRLSGSPNITLLNAIDTICRDAGYDYIVNLKIQEDFHIISLKLRDKKQYVDPGLIDLFIENNRGKVISYEKGEELRNDITSGVLLGGDIETMLPMVESGNGETIWPFWDYQPSAALIPFVLAGNKPVSSSEGYGDAHTVALNALPIRDIIGQSYYICNVLEMRYALASFDSWSAYMARYRPEAAGLVGLEVFPSVITPEEIDFNGESLFSSFADQAGVIQETASGNFFQQDGFSTQTLLQRLQRIHDFVRTVANNYLSQRYVVRIPFQLKYSFEDETNQLSYNLQPTDEGFWADSIPGGSGPLGLAYENFNKFLSQSYKMTPYVYFAIDPGRIDVDKMDPNNYVIQGNGIYIRCNIEPNVIFSPAPSVIISLSEPVWEYPRDAFGGLPELANLFNVGVQELQFLIQQRGGQFPVFIHPRPISPSGVALCLKSNESTYGPWAKIGEAGQVRVEQDTSLVPWNYGGFEMLDKVAEAQLADIGGSYQTLPTATISLAGEPNHSLGDPLIIGGPIITAIDFSKNAGGIRTTYRMRSETPTAGAFSKANIARIQRLAIANQDLKREIRALADRLGELNRQTAKSSTGFQTFRKRMTGAIENETAQTALYGYVFTNPNTGRLTPVVTTSDFKGAIGSSKAGAESFRSVATVGMQSIFRPFSTNTAAPEAIEGQQTPLQMPHYEEPSDYTVGKTITTKDLHPYKEEHNNFWLANGEEFNGFYTGRESAAFDPDNVRSLGQVLPANYIGWGFDMFGKPVPNLDYEETLNQNRDDTEFIEDHRNRFDLAKAGQLDIRWCHHRKVWSFPCGIDGTYNGRVNGEHTMKLDGYQDIIEIDLKANKDNPLTVGAWIACIYLPLKNKWTVIAAQC